MSGRGSGRWGRSSLLLREPELRLENLHLMFGEHFGGRYRGQVRKGRPHGYGQLGKLLADTDTWAADKKNLRPMVGSSKQRVGPTATPSFS
jgi:hypothetical protein